MKTRKQTIDTGSVPTWCPGCWNFQILAGVKSFLNEKIKTENDKEDWAIVSGIGCASKMFDYVNLNGINSLHGRVIPTCLGMKVGNPNLNILGFAGDGDAYSEGMEHLIHAARYNSDFKYIVHNNQVFALTVGQPTPTTEQGFKDKTTPYGEKLYPINPIKLMLASGCGFVARVFADVNQIKQVLEEASNYKGFAFIEVIQPCLIFHPDIKLKEHTYNLQESGHDKTNIEQAMKKADEFDYNFVGEKTKIPVGIFFQQEKPDFEDKFEQLSSLKKKMIGWKDIKR
jgi:2-oxoglutarate/2-oxoacid ferredoxin oxidoreductase subunit beta